MMFIGSKYVFDFNPIWPLCSVSTVYTVSTVEAAYSVVLPLSLMGDNGEYRWYRWWWLIGIATIAEIKERKPMTGFVFSTFTSDEEEDGDDDGTKYRHRDNLKRERRIKRLRRCVMHVSDGPGWISKPRSCTHTLTPFSIHLPPTAQVHHRHSRLSHLCIRGTLIFWLSSRSLFDRIFKYFDKSCQKLQIFTKLCQKLFKCGFSCQKSQKKRPQWLTLPTTSWPLYI